MRSISVPVIVTLICVKCLQTVSSTEVEMEVRPGDNITLYCNHKVSNQLEIEWHRKCTHDNQPELVMFGNFETPFPRFHLTWNHSTNSVDLMIENITEQDLGLYYCEGITKENAFNVLFADPLPTPQPSGSPPSDPDHCWMLLASLCPVCVVLCIISSICVCCFTHEKELKNKKNYQTLTDTADSTTTVVIYTT